MNHDGRLELFYSLGNTPYHAFQKAAAVEQGWAVNAAFGGATIGSPVVASDSGGRLHIFAKGSDGNVYYNWQLTPGGAWSGWSLLAAGPVAEPPVVTENTDGTLQVFAVINNMIYTDQQVTPGNSSNWTGWVGLSGANIAAAPSTVTDYSGNLYIFAQGTDSAAWYDVRSAATGTWSGWSSLGGGIFGSPSAALNADGRVEIFALGSGGVPYHNSQNSDLSTWSGWSSLGGALVTTPIAAVNANGCIEVFGVGTAGGAWHNWQETPGGVWTGWNSLGGTMSSPIAAFRNVDGRLEIFAVIGPNGGGMYSNYQVSPSGGWSGWYPVGSASNPQTSSGAYYSGFAFDGGSISEAENDALWNYWGGSKPTTAQTPTQPYWTWPCATVAVSFQGFPSKYQTKLQKAIDNWNKGLASLSPSGHPVYFTRGAGDGVHSIAVRYTKIVADPQDTSPITGLTQGYTHLWSATKDVNGRLLHVNIDIANTINVGDTMTAVLAHEIGHTFQLADCKQCGTPGNPGQPFGTVMSSRNNPTQNPVTSNLYAPCVSNPNSQECIQLAVNYAQNPKAPTPADLNAIKATDSWLLSCPNQTRNQTISCNDGSAASVTEGFASAGTVGEPVTTCDGTACDSCNGQCSNFAPANCTGNTSGGGGSGGGSSNICDQPAP